MIKLKVEMVEKSEIALTELETQIFATLMDVLNKNQLTTTLRVAGGWVRDKVSLLSSCNFSIAFGP